MMNEKRNSTRVKIISEVIITHEGHIYKGTLKNLSINGAFIQMKDDIEPYEDISIKIKMKGDLSAKTKSIIGVVSRSDTDGIGVQFKDMDLASFKTIKDIAKLYTDDYKKIDKDLYKLKIN